MLFISHISRQSFIKCPPLIFPIRIHAANKYKYMCVCVCVNGANKCDRPFAHTAISACVLFALFRKLIATQTCHRTYLLCLKCLVEPAQESSSTSSSSSSLATMMAAPPDTHTHSECIRAYLLRAHFCAALHLTCVRE